MDKNAKIPPEKPTDYERQLGEYKNLIKKYVPFSERHEQWLYSTGNIANDDKESKMIMYDSGRQIVVEIVESLGPKSAKETVELIQEGNKALYIAANKFDYKPGAR
jgi:DNA-directed RNA polymerase sigma subunit (sigma70/sigma32)